MVKEIKIEKGSVVRNKRTKANRKIVAVVKTKTGNVYHWKSGKVEGKCSELTLKRWIAGSDN